MQTFTKNIRNYLKIKDEPEQLDLFGWHPSRESASTSQHTISSVVCHQIASAVCAHHSLTTNVSHLRNLLIHQCSDEPSQSVWRDYVVGLASTMSFLPTPMQQTFHHSDRAALASDWANVQSDLD